MGQMLLMIDGTRTFLPYLRKNKRHHRPSNDRWIREQKCKQKSMGIAINVVGMGGIEKPLPSIVDRKVALLKKKFISVLKLRALVHVYSLLLATGIQPCHQNPRFESLHILSSKHQL